MRILWISSIAWENENGYEYPTNGPGAVSGSIFQQSMIKGLEELGAKVDLVADYPYSGVIFARSKCFSHSEDSADVIIETCGIPYLSAPIKSYFVKKAVRKALKQCKYDYVIAYLIHSPYLEGIKEAKRLDGNIKSVLICPDLPDMMDMSLQNKKLKSFLKRFDYRKINRLYNYVDGFVLFSEYMKERLPAESKPWTVIEGVATVEKLDLNETVRSKAMMYAGTLHKNIGIESILDSLRYLPEDLELWIFGDGELKEEIIARSRDDVRITFFGFMPREEVFEYEKRASVLVNARNPDDLFTKYSFPSKTFEYLYSGTPFVTTKLTGVPKEYDDYLYLIPDNKPETIAHKVSEILNTDKGIIEDKAKKARSFIKTKLYKSQARKLSDFIATVN